MHQQLPIDQWRADTPGISQRIHLNNAGAALMPAPVLRAMTDHLQLEASIGGYEAAAARQPEIAGFYQAFARLLNARPHQVAFAGSATDAYNKALSAIPFQAGDTILTTTDDYVSNQIAFLQLQRRFGVRLVRAADLPGGGVDVNSIAELIRRNQPRLVAITHIPTSSGLVQPVAEIGRLCRENDTLYLVDACQSAGQLPLDVEAVGCDFLSATCRKFLRGPRGAGFLYTSERVLEAGLEPLFLDLHSARWSGTDAYDAASTARRFELWERPYALLLGSKAAAEYALKVGLPVIWQRARQLAARLREQLAGIPGLRVLDQGPELGAIVTFHIPGQQAEALKKDLDQQGFNTSLTFHDSARFDFDRKGVDWALRASPHYYNTEEEVDGFVEAVRRGQERS